MPPRSTLGTSYGWISAGLLGFLVCGPIAAIRSRRGPYFRVSIALICGSLLGAVAVAGADAASDWIDLSLERFGIPRDVVTVSWSVFITEAIILTVLTVSGFPLPPLKRVLAVSGIASVASFLVARAAEFAVAIFIVARILTTPAAERLRLNLGPVQS